MSTGIKIPRTVFIEKLKAKLKQNEEALAENEKRQLAQQVVVNKNNAALIKAIYKNPNLVSHVHRSYNGTASIHLNNVSHITEVPEPEMERVLYSGDIDTLKETIAVLELSDSEYVPATIAKNTSRFLI